MNYSFFKKISIFSIACITSYSLTYAAKITVDTPSKNANNRNPITVRIVVDSEGDTLSGISGNFSFPTDLYTLQDISTESSVVSLWVTQPRVSEERYLDGRTHIPFEGIFPGGYSGVRSAYYNGVHGGVAFSVTLIPKHAGKGVLLVDDIGLHAFTKEAALLSVENAITFIEIPNLSIVSQEKVFVTKEVESPTLAVFVTHDELVNANAWYLVVNEREQKSSEEAVYIAETDVSDPHLLDEYAWRSEKVPYVLLFQDRTKYIHVKVVYTNHTYTLRTIVPVENSQSIPTWSRILGSVATLLFLLYLYVTFFFTHSSFSKKETP